MSIKIRCGNHNGQTFYHGSIAEARACYFPETSPTAPAPKVTATGERLSDIPAATRTAVLDRMATSGGYTDAERAEWKRLWNSDAATEDQQEADERGELHRNRFAATAPAAPKGDATDKQLSYLASLLSDRVAPNEDFRAYAGSVQDAIEAGTLRKFDASKAISRMRDWAKAPRSYTIDGSGQGITDPRGALAEEDGIYRDPNTGRIFKVQYNRATGDGRHLYAKRLVVDGSDAVTLEGAPGSGRERDLSWVYEGGIAKSAVEKAWRMNREDAAKFGALYGVCVRCHRDLTAEESIDRAMGPICAGKMGW